MSKFYDFFRNSKNIEIESRVSSKDKTPNYFLNSLRTYAMPLLLTGTFLTPNLAEAESLQTFKTTFSQLASKYEKTGLLNVNNPAINIISLNDTSTGSHHIAGLTNSCKITIALDKNFNPEGLEKKSIQTKNKEIYREMAFNHELSHCIINKQFIKSGLSKKSEKWMQDWIVGDYATFNPVKNLFEENFADVMGMMITLKNHGYSKESLNFLDEWKIQRKNNREQEEQNLAFLTDGHQTDFALKYLQDNLSKVEKFSDDEYKMFAMEAASRAVIYTLNSKRKMEGNSFVNDNGDMVSGKKIFVGNKGYNTINKVLNNYNETILKNAVTYDYIKQNKININNNIDATPYVLAKEIVEETHIFENTKAKAVQKEDGTLALQINNDDANLAINLQFSSNLVRDKFTQLKNKDDFSSFKKELSKILSEEYTLSTPKYSKGKEKWLSLEKRLAENPFSTDKVSINPKNSIKK